MLVRLKRDFFLGGHLYKASRFGVEIPGEIDGKPVKLPSGAEILDKAPEPKKAQDPAMALSKLNQAKPKGFVEAMATKDDDE